MLGACRLRGFPERCWWFPRRSWPFAVLDRHLELGRESAAAPPRIVDANSDVYGSRWAVGIGRSERTLVVFSDYQCPFSARMQAVLDSIPLHELDLRIEYRHLPLPTVHPLSLEAAVSAECAGEQRRFIEYHRVLLANQQLVGERQWREFAELAGIEDVNAFDECLYATEMQDRVTSDMRLAELHGIRGTPSFVFAGAIRVGFIPSDTLMSWLAEK